MYKDAVHHLGANKTPQFIVRIGKVLGPLTAPKAVDFSVQIHVSGSHTCCSDSKDVEIIVEELKKNAMCSVRHHHKFKTSMPDIKQCTGHITILTCSSTFLCRPPDLKLDPNE